MDIKKLKAEVEDILARYLSNPEDAGLKKQAEKAYLSALSIDPMLPKELSTAKNMLVGIAYNTGIKLKTEAVKEALRKLKERP